MKHPFELYDLEVVVTGDPETFVCAHTAGVAFKVIGENLVFETPGTFSLYALSTLLPLLPAKQRQTHPNDWMTTDESIACPDPHCAAQFTIRRTGTTVFDHGDVTKVPLP